MKLQQSKRASQSELLPRLLRPKERGFPFIWDSSRRVYEVLAVHTMEGD